MHQLRQRLCPWDAQLAPGVRTEQERLICLFIKEDLSSCRLVEYLLRWEPSDLHDHGKLFLLIFPREYRIPSLELNQYASETPHVDSGCVGDPKNDFGGSVETRLDICVNSFILEAARAKVDDFDTGFVRALKQDVLWLQVTMYDALLTQVLKSLEYLNGEASDQAEGDTCEVVVLDELIEVDGKELEADHEVLPEHHVVLNANDVEGIVWVVLLQVHQDLQLYACLVLETLLISDQLNRDVLLGFVVEAFDSLPE